MPGLPGPVAPCTLTRQHAAGPAPPPNQLNRRPPARPPARCRSNLTVGSWSPLGGSQNGFVTVKGLREGGILAVSGSDGSLWMRSSVSTSATWAVLGSATNLFGTGSGRALRQSSGSKAVPMDVEQMADGSLLVLGSDRKLYTMANLTAPLVAVPVTDAILVDRISAGPSE